MACGIITLLNVEGNISQAIPSRGKLMGGGGARLLLEMTKRLRKNKMMRSRKVRK